MRRNDLVLGIVLVVAVIGAGLMAQTLHDRQLSIANARDKMSRMPIAGFQKFMADVVWMRFLYYAGGNQLNADTVEAYDHYINLIIRLDPDFFRAYRDGALMLGPIAPDKALAIIDAACDHPRLKSRWELPMMAGQILVRSEWQNFYAGKDLDPEKLAKAEGYFLKAKNAPNHRPTAVTSYIRTRSLAKSAKTKTPVELAELMEWRDYWQSTRFEMEGMPFAPVMPMPAGRPTAAPPAGVMPDVASGEMMSGPYFPLDVEQRILSLIRKIAKAYVQDPKATDEQRTAGETLIKETITKVFPNTKFDIESYIPYETGSLGCYRGTVEAPATKTYVVELDAQRMFAVKDLTIKAAKGGVKVTVLINGKPVNGLEQVDAGQEKQTFTAVRANKVNLKDTVELQFADVKDAADIAYVLTVYEGNYF